MCPNSIVQFFLFLQWYTTAIFFVCNVLLLISCVSHNILMYRKRANLSDFSNNGIPLLENPHFFFNVLL